MAQARSGKKRTSRITAAMIQPGLEFLVISPFTTATRVGDLLKCVSLNSGNAIFINKSRDDRFGAGTEFIYSHLEIIDDSLIEVFVNRATAELTASRVDYAVLAMQKYVSSIEGVDPEDATKLEMAAARYLAEKDTDEIFGDLF